MCYTICDTALKMINLKFDIWLFVSYSIFLHETPSVIGWVNDRLFLLTNQQLTLIGMSFKYWKCSKYGLTSHTAPSVVSGFNACIILLNCKMKLFIIVSIVFIVIGWNWTNLKYLGQSSGYYYISIFMKKDGQLA